MQIPRLFSHSYGMPTLAKPVCCTCFHKLSYCNSALSCKVKVWNWSQTHTSDRFYRNSSSSHQSTDWLNKRLNSAGAGGHVLPRVEEAPHQSCQLSWKPLLSKGSILLSPKREQQLAEVHNLPPHSQPREGWACKALNSLQRKQLSPKEVCCLLRSGLMPSRATNPSRLPTTW